MPNLIKKPIFFSLQDPDGNDNKSESGSFHALAWEEERSRRSQVKWAGDYQHPDAPPPSQSNLRREPTPFPKEMRAMAKRVQNLRNKKSGGEVPADDLTKKKRRASIEISQENIITMPENDPPPPKPKAVSQF